MKKSGNAPPQFQQAADAAVAQAVPQQQDPTQSIQAATPPAAAPQGAPTKGGAMPPQMATQGAQPMQQQSFSPSYGRKGGAAPPDYQGVPPQFTQQGQGMNMANAMRNPNCQ